MKSLTTPREAFFTVCLICAMMVACFFISCNNDDENTPSDLLIGTWTFSSSTMDLSINGKTLVQYLIDESGLSQSEAETLADLLFGMIEDEYTPGSDVSIQIKSDGTYIMTGTDMNDDGTWELSSDGKTLTLDKGTEYEMVFDVESLTKSTLTILSQQSLEDDFNADSVNETMHIELEMTLNKK